MATRFFLPVGHAQPPQAAGAAPAVSVPLPTTPPPGALVLFAGKAKDLDDNWTRRYSGKPVDGTIGPDNGVTLPKTDIITKQSFGDCFLHVEFQCPTGGHGGNAGVGLQGRYEVQIFGSYGQKPEATNAGAFYSQRPARTIASKKAGEWESYDIIFRAPRVDPAGRVIEKARATVFHNGILVQNNEEFLGMTGIQYGEFKTEQPTGPLILQGDHDAVRYRNVWLVRL